MREYVFLEKYTLFAEEIEISPVIVSFKICIAQAFESSVQQ